MPRSAFDARIDVGRRYWVLHDDQNNAAESARKTGRGPRELGVLAFEEAEEASGLVVWKLRAVVIPRVRESDNQVAQFRPSIPEESILSRWKSGRDAAHIIVMQAAPVAGGIELRRDDSHASVALTARGGPEVELEYGFPISIYQAFAIGVGLHHNGCLD